MLKGLQVQKWRLMAMARYPMIIYLKPVDVVSLIWKHSERFWAWVAIKRVYIPVLYNNSFWHFGQLCDGIWRCFLLAQRFTFVFFQSVDHRNSVYIIVYNNYINVKSTWNLKSLDVFGCWSSAFMILHELLAVGATIWPSTARYVFNLCLQAPADQSMRINWFGLWGLQIQWVGFCGLHKAWRILQIWWKATLLYQLRLPFIELWEYGCHKGPIKALLLQRKRNVNNYFDFDLYIPLTQIQSNKNHCTLCTSNSMIPFRNTKTSHADDCLERNTVHATNAEVHGRSSRSHLVSALCRLLHRAPWINRTWPLWTLQSKEATCQHRIIPFLVDICWYQTLRKWISCQSALTLLCGIWTVETFGIAAPNWHEWWIEVMMLYLLTCDESGINAVAIWVRLRTLMISHDWVRVCLKSHFISFYHILAILVADYCHFVPMKSLGSYPSISIYIHLQYQYPFNLWKHIKAIRSFRSGSQHQLGRLSLVDLAGSERIKCSEARAIAVSVLCWKMVLSQEYHKYVLSQLCTFST